MRALNNCALLNVRGSSKRGNLRALLLLAIFCGPMFLRTKAAAENQSATVSLADSINRAHQGTQFHIFYVHGIGINPPKVGAQDFESSQEFRSSFCKISKQCKTDQWEREKRDYASAHRFAINSSAPYLSYLGKNLWTDEEWHAAAPFVDHYTIALKDGSVIYVDEMNWWPLILGPKCRKIVEPESQFIGPDAKHLDICAVETKPDLVPGNAGRFTSYRWLKGDEQLKQLPAKGAKFNRDLKSGVLDWGFADALMAVGPMRSLFLEGIRELILASVRVSADGARGEGVTPAPNQEFAVVSHSLGSYLMFSALDSQDDLTAANQQPWKPAFETVLGQTSHAYFLANQVRLLELANLDDTSDQSKKNIVTHLQAWADARRHHGQTPLRSLHSAIRVICSHGRFQRAAQCQSIIGR
jgi:hypothetical protein